MATLESLQSKIKKLEKQAEELIAKEASTVIARIRDLMTKHNLTAADIDAHVNGVDKRAMTAEKKASIKPRAKTPRYQDPKTGATWTGHGRAPAWIARAKNRDAFLVKPRAETEKATPFGKSTAAGNYVRGPQPALYRDPKSGLTWSGRGRAPAWLASLKDRSKFLIDGKVASVPTKKAATPKLAVKKSASKKVVTARAVKATLAKKPAAADKTVASKKAPVAARKTVGKAAVAPAKPAAARKGRDKASPIATAVDPDVGALG